jgi:3-oxoadipate enol-lactonase
MSIHYESRGQGPLTIVLTHGLAASNDTWQGQIDAFAGHYRTIRWDLRGHGRSTSPPGPYSLHDLGTDLRDVLDSAGVERAILLGHSAGGVVAMQCALDYPQRIAGLVFVGTASECNTRAADFYEKLAAIAPERGMDPVRKRLGVPSEAEGGPPVDPVAFAKIARAMAGLNREPLTGRLGEIHCPTLAIVGEKDFLGAGGSVILSRNIRDAQLQIVPGRGHGLFLEDPAGFNHIVLNFLQRVSTETAMDPNV